MVDLVGKSMEEELLSLNYGQHQSPGRLFSAFIYEDVAKIFHTKNGEFASIFKIEPYDAMILTKDDMYGIRSRLKTVCNYITEDCSASYTRFSIPNIDSELKAYRDGHKESLRAFESEVAEETWWGKNTYSDAIEKSMLDRYLKASRHPKGFMENVDEEDLSQAISDYANEIADEELAELIVSNSRRANRGGMKPMKHVHWFVVKWSPQFLFGRGINNLWKYLKVGSGITSRNEIEKLAYGNHLKEFIAIRDDIKAALGNANLQPKIVAKDEYEAVLYSMFNPRRAVEHLNPGSNRDVPIGQVINGAAVLPHENIAENICFGKVTTEPKGLKIEESNEIPFYYRSVSLLSRLTKLNPGLLQTAIDSSTHPGWTTVNIRPVRKYTAKARLYVRRKWIENKKQENRSKDKSLTESDLKTDQELTHVEEALDAPLIDDRDQMYDVAVHSVIGGENRLALESDASQLAKSGYWDRGISEETRGDAVINASIPLNYAIEQEGLLRRHQPYMSEATSDFLPVYTHFKGIEPSGTLFANRFGAPVFIDLFGDRTKTAHSLVVGTTGTGKSFVTNYILASVICKYNTVVRIFDKGGSYEDLCNNMDGDYVELSMDDFRPSGAIESVKPACLNPLHLETDSKTDKLLVPPASSITAIAYQLVSMRAALHKKLGNTPDDFNILKLNLVIDALTKFFKLWVDKKTIPPTLSHFMRYLSKTRLGKQSGADVAHEFKAFYGDGPYAKAFDGQLTFSWRNPFIVIETKRLGGDPLLGTLVVNLLRQIGDDMIFNIPLARKKIIAVDESWSALADPQGAKTLAEFLRTLRKENCGIILISQFLADFISVLKAEGDGGDDGILGNTSHFIFLPSSKSDLALAREYLGFTENATAMWESLAGAPPFYSEIFYTLKDEFTQLRHGIIRYVASPLIFWLSSSHPDDRSYRAKVSEELVARGTPRKDAKREAVLRGARDYPFGKRYGKVKKNEVEENSNDTKAA